ncbi:MAG: nuclear transport factor 2 family protein [Cyanobacteria bacterium P01_G01_bin.49]
MYNPVQQFFLSVANRDLTGVFETVNDNVVFEAQGPKIVPIYGRFEGKKGVEKFVNTLFDLFDTEAFEIRKWAFSEDFVFAYGYMQHRVRQTNKVFKSEWSLVCRLENDRISSYKMFEDTAALQSAYNQS